MKVFFNFYLSIFLFSMYVFDYNQKEFRSFAQNPTYNAPQDPYLKIVPLRSEWSPYFKNRVADHVLV